MNSVTPTAAHKTGVSTLRRLTPLAFIAVISFSDAKRLNAYRVATSTAIGSDNATVSGMDYLLTWNFKHIANAAMRANVELVCRLNGYEPPVICSPMELMEV